MAIALKEYVAKVDMKKRITLRGAKYSNYHVQELANGKIILEPRELINPFEISKNSLNMMDASIKNLKNNKTSQPVDVSAFENINE